jgi:hypothetical protein
MRINDLRGSVADRPIDSRVVQDGSYPGTAMARIQTAMPDIQQVHVSKRSDYDKGHC